MAERRQVFRREPIEVEVRGHVYVAEPLPWQIVNDLGNEIVRQNVEATNEAVRLFTQDDLPQLALKLQQKISDWNPLLIIAYPKDVFTAELGLDIDEAATLVLASMEVNHLEHLNHLVDPNFQPPTLNGGSETSGETATPVGVKIESLLGSSSTESIETPSSPSPEENS